MIKFISNIIGLSLIILLFNGVVFLFATHFYYNAYEIFPDKNYQSFILADSHGLPIGNFSEKFEVYNFSGESDSYFDIKRKLTYLLEHEYTVNTIYITVDDYTLSPYRNITNNLDRSVVYTSSLDYHGYFTFLKEKYLKYYLPIFRPKIRSLFKSYLTAKVDMPFQKKNNLSNSFIWHNLSDQDQIERAENRKRSQFPSNERSEELENTLIEIVNLCQMNNIELIGLKFPLPKSYLKIIGDSNSGADELFYSRGIEVIDFKSIFIDKDELFFNEDHMNSEGGEIFTKSLFNK